MLSKADRGGAVWHQVRIERCLTWINNSCTSRWSWADADGEKCSWQHTWLLSQDQAIHVCEACNTSTNASWSQVSQHWCSHASLMGTCLTGNPFGSVSTPLSMTRQHSPMQNSWPTWKSFWKMALLKRSLKILHRLASVMTKPLLAWSHGMAIHASCIKCMLGLLLKLLHSKMEVAVNCANSMTQSNNICMPWNQWGTNHQGYFASRTEAGSNHNVWVAKGQSRQGRRSSLDELLKFLDLRAQAQTSDLGKNIPGMSYGSSHCLEDQFHHSSLLSATRVWHARWPNTLSILVYL